MTTNALVVCVLVLFAGFVSSDNILANNNDNAYAFLEQGQQQQQGLAPVAPIPHFQQLFDSQPPQPQPTIQTQQPPTIVVGGAMQLARLPAPQPVVRMEEEDPEMMKLKQALEAVKEDIVANSKMISDERKWVHAVRKIVLSYEDKMKRVNDHILALRKEQKVLFDKKKQIENLRLQRKLQRKLKKASEELKTLQYSLDHVQQKSHELNAEHANLQSTISKIETQLIKLKGADPNAMKPKKKNKKKKNGDKGEAKADKNRDDKFV
jgi:predicted  nucleic acid-binding Zn-ribbon protein